MATGRRHRTGRGYTYLGLLFAVAIGGVLLASLGELASTAGQREREAELQFRAAQIRQAIERYASSTPTGSQRWPQTLEDLTADRRHTPARHHLRQRYADPFTREADWELLPAPGGASGFMGVRSKARVKPLGAPPVLPGSNTSGAASDGWRSDAVAMRACVCAWAFVAAP